MCPHTRRSWKILDGVPLDDGTPYPLWIAHHLYVIAAQDGSLASKVASVETWEWIVISTCLVLSGLFSASETALTALTQPKVRQLIETEPEQFGGFQLWLDHPNRVLSTILVGNNLVNILASALATDISGQLFGHQGVAVAVGVMTFLVLVFGEVVPKTYAKHHAEPVAMRLFPVLVFTYWLCLPVTWVLVFIATGLVRLFGGDLDRSGPFVTEEDIEYLIDLGTREGVLDQEKERLLQSILEFDDITIREVMVPRTDTIVLALDASPEEVMELAQHSAHSRIPVYDEQIDNVKGILYLRDLFRMHTSNGGDTKLASTWTELLRTPYFVPGSMKISDLLKEFQRRKSHMAIVVDEFGGTMGIVTMEDILEEIVGEIHDEYDTDEMDEIITVSEHVYHADAKVSLRSLEELLSIEFPDDGDYETLGGFLTAHEGRVPQCGDAIENAGYRFVVLDANEKHVSLVEIRREVPLSNTPEPMEAHRTPSELPAALKSESL